MSIIDRIKSMFNNVFNRKKAISEPQEKQVDLNETRNAFEESLKVDLNNTNNDNKEKETEVNILECEGDGTGIQHINKY
jgi:hypothetical protein